MSARRRLRIQPVDFIASMRPFGRAVESGLLRRIARAEAELAAKEAEVSAAR